MPPKLYAPWTEVIYSSINTVQSNLKKEHL